MKWNKLQLVLLICGLALCSTVVQADDSVSSHELPDDVEDIDAELALLRQIEEESLKKERAHEDKRAHEIASKIANEIGLSYNVKSENGQMIPFLINPCAKIHCSAGRVCKSENNSAKCICIPECPEETDPRRLVCTNKNETWASDCEVHRHRCLCNDNATECKGPEFKHIHIDYYGECKELPECVEEELNDFPRRMRDWLFNIMRDLAERKELAEHFLELELEAETNLTRRWANAAVWKWCDLDQSHDRSVSRHELFPIRAHLLALEHCIAPFLKSCDSDDDHRITLKEWGKCLELNEEDMLDRCDDIATNDGHYEDEDDD